MPQSPPHDASSRSTAIGRWVIVGEYLRNEVVAMLEATARRWLPRTVRNAHEHRLEQVAQAYFAAADVLRELAARFAPRSTRSRGIRSPSAQGSSVRSRGIRSPSAQGSSPRVRRGAAQPQATPRADSATE
jgi:hypothetical protein